MLSAAPVQINGTVYFIFGLKMATLAWFDESGSYFDFEKKNYLPRKFYFPN